MSNLPPVQRSNPLVDRLNELTRLNEQYVPRAAGGSGAPIAHIPIPPDSGGGTVLPPEPGPEEVVTPEEQAELERLWAADVARRAAALRADSDRPVRPRGALDAPLPRDSEPEPENIVLPVSTGKPLSKFIAIDIDGMQVVADNGDRFAVRESEMKQVVQFCFEVMHRELQARINEVYKNLGLVEPTAPKETPSAEPTQPKRRTRKAKQAE